MAISRTRFEQIKAKWGRYSSWAVWAPLQPGDRPTARVGDLSVLDPDANPKLLDSLTTDLVLLGLNASSREIASVPFRNFHDPSGDAKDYRLRFAVAGTDHEGAFVTDILEGLHQTDSGEVKRWTEANPILVREHFERLDEKLQDLGSSDPLLAALGGQAFELARRHFGDSRRIIKLTHYSHRMNLEDYREKFLAAIANAPSAL